MALIGLCMPNAFVASNDFINEKQTRSLRKGKHQASEQWEPSQNVIAMDHETVDYTVAKIADLNKLKTLKASKNNEFSNRMNSEKVMSSKSTNKSEVNPKLLSLRKVFWNL